MEDLSPSPALNEPRLCHQTSLLHVIARSWQSQSTRGWRYCHQSPIGHQHAAMRRVMCTQGSCFMTHATQYACQPLLAVHPLTALKGALAWA